MKSKDYDRALRLRDKLEWCMSQVQGADFERYNEVWIWVSAALAKAGIL